MVRRANEDVWVDWPGHSDILGLREYRRSSRDDYRRLRKKRIGVALRRLVVQRDGFACRYCGSACFVDLTLEHVVPVSRGGASAFDNLVVACRWCNVRKGNKTVSEAGMTLLPVPVR